MRVLVASDHLGALTSRETGSILAEAWQGHDVVVVPMGEAGSGWLQSVADQVDEAVAMLPCGDGGGRSGAGGSADDAAPVALMVAGADLLAVAVESGRQRNGIDWTASSAPLGAAVAAALADTTVPRTLAIDLGGLTSHDAGAGFLQALGARADRDLTGGVGGLGQVGFVDIEPVRDLLGGCELVGIIPSADRNAHLLGLRGITSIAGREAGLDQARMLAADGSLERFVGQVAPEVATEAGAGAAGGLGWAIRALGGRLVTGPDFAAERYGLAELAEQAELIVTGCASFDFASRGGGVVAALANLAESTMTPCIVVAGTVVIGAREMRTMGVEAAYPAWPDGVGGDPVDGLRAVARRVARTWSW